MDNLADFEGRKQDHFSGFGFSLLGLRGWGGVPSILRKTSSGLFSLSPWLPLRLRSFFSDIMEPSLQPSVGLDDDLYKEKAKVLLTKTTEIFYKNLDDYEYGMPYADETILKNILRELVRLDLTNQQKIERVLQFLPQHPEYLRE